jgi:MoaA/NifB/PqqE/SkfB family radical SAM enzyme
VAKDGLGELWSSAKLESVRADLVSGRRRSECRACWELEDMGMVSLRQGQLIQRGLENKERVAEWLSQGRLPWPHTLELKLSNLCNLKCRMCSPAASTPWIKEWAGARGFYAPGEARGIDKSYDMQISKREPVLDHFLTNEKFMSDLSAFADDIRELEFAGGEPLLDPLHYEVLEKVLPRAADITLKYSTNLMMLGTRRFDVMEMWKRFKGIKLTVSIDGPPELNEYIRTGTVTETLEANLRRVRELPNVELKGSTCVSAYNALFLRETFEYVISLGMTWYSNRVRSPRFLDARILPRELRDRAIASLRAFDESCFTRAGMTKDMRLRSTRTQEDCISWLNDDRLHSEATLRTFLSYKNHLDSVRKTSYAALDRALSDKSMAEVYP